MPPYEHLRPAWVPARFDPTTEGSHVTFARTHRTWTHAVGPPAELTLSRGSGSAEQYLLGCRSAGQAAVRAARRECS